METEKTLILIKPDGIQRGLAGRIIERLENTGLRIAGIRMLQIDEDLAARHYAEHVGKPFYAGLVRYITSGPVLAICLDGPGAIGLARKVVGATDPVDAAPGTIRGDFGIDISRNLIHGSANAADAEREVELFFGDGGLVEYDRASDPWIVGPE